MSEEKSTEQQAPAASEAPLSDDALESVSGGIIGEGCIVMPQFPIGTPPYNPFPMGNEERTIQ